MNISIISKISTLRNNLDNMNVQNSHPCPDVSAYMPTSNSILDTFHPCTVEEIIKIVNTSSKATCELDPLPTKLLVDILPTLAPVLCEIVNMSLSSGEFPSSLKSAIVRPLLKKAGLDLDNLKNYRPVSNLSFLSKLLEKVVVNRLIDHMSVNNLLDPMQSAYRKAHSTETALLRLKNDMSWAIDRGLGILLVLLDLSSAFDTVDHAILITFFEKILGLKGKVLDWFRSYLSSRTQSVSIGSILSDVSELVFGVPQGSVLGPIEFCIYTTPLGAILRQHGLSYQIYADDTSIYCTFDMSAPEATVEKINACIGDIKAWMIANKLKINDDKTEFVVITSPRAVVSSDLHITIGNTNVSPDTKCKSLGVMLDAHLSMEAQVNSVCRSMNYHLRNIRKIRPLITQPIAAQLVHSLISSRLDYCNSLLYGIPDSLLSRLQRVQNTAARIVSRCPRASHITPVLEELHWLPVRARIQFKILLLTYKCVHGLAPQYLCELITPYSNVRSLRSNTQLLLNVPKSRLRTSGDRAFCVAAPTEWNKLPIEIKMSDTVSCFKGLLKTHLYKQYFSN